MIIWSLFGWTVGFAFFVAAIVVLVLGNIADAIGLAVCGAIPLIIVYFRIWGSPTSAKADGARDAPRETGAQNSEKSQAKE
jgi:hypothetical protein